MALNENLGAKKDNLTLIATIKQISFACRSLSYYNANLRHVVASQKSQRRFNELGKEMLLNLANIFQFDSKAKIDSFKVGTKKAVETAKLILAIDQQLLKAGKPINQKPKMISVLQYADSIDDFTTISTEMTLLDYRSFGDLGANDKEINKIKSFLKANPFNNLTYYTNKKNACIEKIRDLKSGKFFALPLVGVEISLLQFVIISWLINLCVILYVRNVWTNLNNYWKEYKENSGNNLTTIEETKALWYEVSVAIENKTLFTIFHSVFLSFITVTGLVFGLILFNYSGLELISLLCATVIIVLISIFCAVRFYNIYQSA